MPRYALKIEYHGASYSGWQRQKSHPSVQQELETALRKLEPETPDIAAAGRTDAGVHATAQVAHCDLDKDWDPFRLAQALNFHLKPQPIAVIDVSKAPDDFHARFSATQRRYLFRLIARRAPLTHDKNLAWRVPHPLDLEPMQAAANHLLGTHDFTTFRASDCQAKSPIKTLDHLDIKAINLPHATEFRFHFQARSFLHNQVRSIVGTLERVGAGAWKTRDVQTALVAQNRAACGPVCPPHGLYLTQVSYPDDPFSASAR